MFQQTLIFISHPATLLLLAAFVAMAVLWRIFGAKRAVLFAVIDIVLFISSFSVMLILKATLSDMLTLLMFAAAAHLVLVRTGADKEEEK